MYLPNLKSVALPVPEIITIVILGGVHSAHPNLGDGEALGSREWYRSKEHW